ncbi:kinesin, putative [Bodo saltans]|uniref:Kinesin-like protein n=1 Tax=Bodo saltans TaxID=75058 RepID=A0A0S4IR67_BODSA|nr:kinesin, putative [Bodo saltans]|eukprot:CUF36996.1 kinesin, putative [Bodo saltans]
MMKPKSATSTPLAGDNVRRGRATTVTSNSYVAAERRHSMSPAPLSNGKARSNSTFASGTFHGPSSPAFGSPTLSSQDSERLLTADETAVLQRRSTEITRFRVFSRVRPFIEEELWEMKDGILRSVVEMSGKKTILLDPKEEWAPKSEFEFDASLWSIPPTQKLQVTFQDALHETHQTQQDVYNLVAKSAVPSAFDGFNSCILTYGQTGSGKTYTMMGKYNPTAVCGGDGEEGIIPRVCNDIFQLLEERRTAEKSKPESERITYRIEVNFVEIYLERVRDLLDPTLRNSKDARMNEAKIRQDPACGPYVEGVTRYQVENWRHCCQLLERGSTHRTTCATLVHQQSSRSHAIFQITVMMEETIPAKDRYSLPSTRTRAGRINLVDLAGSERGGMTDYVKESAAINSSLLALRRVIDNLVERQNIQMEQARQQIVQNSNSGTMMSNAFNADRVLPQVPFRDSVLTWLLSDSIGGNARTTMVATLSPLAKNFGDTLATLQWSSKARNLVTLVRMNDVQTVVSDGMSSKANELNHAVVLQRQNVDSLRDALQQKKDYVESLDKDTKIAMKKTINEQTQIEEIRRVAAAVVFQRARQSVVLQRRLDTLAQQIASVEKRISLEQLSLEERTAYLEDTRRTKEENEILLLEAMSNEADAKQQVLKIEQTQDEFEKKLMQLHEQADMISGQRGEAEAACQRQIVELEQQIQQLRNETLTMRNDTQKAEAQILLMEEARKKVKDPNWVVNAENSKREVADLKLKVEEMKRKKLEASAKRDFLQGQHNKAYKKK